jgi:hypothetical protein
MKNIPLLPGPIALAKVILFFPLICLSAVSAETFQYSYLFADGINRASGILSGDQIGDSFMGTIANLRVLSLTVDGHLIATDRPGGGDLFSAQWGANGGWIPGGIVSFDPHKNNFIFCTIDLGNGAQTSPNQQFGNFALNKDSALPNGFDEEITYYPYPPGYFGTNEIGTWSLKNTSLSPVPEPATYGVMGTLSLFGLVAAKRFKSKRAEAKSKLSRCRHVLALE